MNTRKRVNGLSVLMIIASFAFITSCDKEEHIEDPADAVTLNMLNAANGKTILGVSDVYINDANNFDSDRSSLIADCGSAAGIGVGVEPMLNNLVYEVAATPGHIYQVFDNDAIKKFPSGTRATQIGATYYKVYVVSPITVDNKMTGAVLKYVSEYPEDAKLPQRGDHIGEINSRDSTVEMDFPEDAEYTFNDEERDFEVVTKDGKLVVKLLKEPDSVYGPYGERIVYIRLGTVYSYVIFEVK